ncbi:MAG: ParA family protein [Candidatus Nanopelagicales bacterium]|jgi:chromosome partitioning protein
MPTTIAVVQLKGGTGRSTLATNLAGALATHSPTVLIDGDMPQGTSAAWYAVRHGAGRAGQLSLATASTTRELVAEAQRYQSAGYLVLDAPPRLADMAKAMLLMADAVLVPCGPSLPEVWATQDTLPVLTDIPHQPPVRLVWTRVRAGVGLSDELTATAAKQLGLAALKARLGYRVAYAAALGDGLTAGETGNRAAREELEALVREVRRL